MRKLTILTILLALCLTSCVILREEGSDPVATLPLKDAQAITEEENLQSVQTDVPGTQSSGSEQSSLEETEAETEPFELPALVGLYDDLQDNGVYTRLDTWDVPWMAGADIAVFDVIPSGEAVISNASYKDMWLAAAATHAAPPKPYLELEYTLADGTVKKCEVRTPADAEAVTAEGYIEVYLYDDIHQSDGAWYSHLMEYDVTDETVISSVKLTAGAAVASVTGIRLTACLDGSLDASVVLTNG